MPTKDTPKMQCPPETNYCGTMHCQKLSGKFSMLFSTLINEKKIKKGKYYNNCPKKH
jgi:hypothetical protein